MLSPKQKAIKNLKKYQVEESLFLTDQRIKDAAIKDLACFTYYTHHNYDLQWYHQTLCKYLNEFTEPKRLRLIVTMPPRHGKSELVSRRLPAWILGKNPDLSIIAASYASDLASMINRDVQRIIDDKKYAEIFPNTKLYGEASRGTAKGSYLRNSDVFEIVGHRGIYRSAGIGGAITGLGCHIGIIDDPIKNAEEAHSPVYRQKLWEWYTSTFYTRLTGNANVLITLTRWHEDDLVGRLLEGNADEWVVINFPAIKEDDENPEDIRQIGDALWPKNFPVEHLMKIKSQSIRDFTSLYQQRPAPPEGSMFKRKNLRNFYKVPPSEFDEIIQSWDLTFEAGEQNDFVVGQVWGRKDSKKYLLDQFRQRIGFNGSVAAVKTVSGKWPKSHDKLVEHKANAAALLDVLKKEIPGLIPVDSSTSKIGRAMAVEGDFEADDIWLPDPSIAPWIHDYIEELATFPRASHDDQVDATTQALLRFRSNIKKIQTFMPVSMTRVSPWK